MQKYIKSYFGIDFGTLNFKTRWDSLLKMIEVFYKIRILIKKALIEIRSELELKMLAAEAICRSDANLINAAAAINLMLEIIESKSSADKVDLIEALNQRTP